MHEQTQSSRLPVTYKGGYEVMQSVFASGPFTRPSTRLLAAERIADAIIQIGGTKATLSAASQYFATGMSHLLAG